ncbi:MAG: protein kinase [Chitinophaga sp.]|uniref:protein kinase domain-containing protein n=1 Tax=Chitinophaga sp. TaxID=1869181 RepID=UPI0025BEB618|nr:protein kinase [Chitinophaga sp.]MBV8251870.1 protein kinase [Chitinophaga sp.]
MKNYCCSAATFPLVENYHLLECTGEGATCHVYKARQQHTGQLVALKVLKRSLLHSQQLSPFEREAKVCRGISHPYIVKLLDKGLTTDGIPFVAFEFLEGHTLKQQLLRNGALSIHDTRVFMGQLLDALCCAHTNGIAHRDLKPENIIILRRDVFPHIKILDFGISAFVQDVMQHADTMGTPAYCAPEQLRGEPPSTKADLYAWGLILIECLTGYPAVCGNSIADIYDQQLSPEVIGIPAFLKDHPLYELLNTVLVKQVTERIGDAHTLFRRFRELDFSIPLKPVTADYRDLTSPVTLDNALARMYEKKDLPH